MEHTFKKLSKNIRKLLSLLMPLNLNLNYENLSVFGCKSTAFF